MKFTFNQLVSAVLAFVLLAVLVSMYFVQPSTDPKIVGAIIGVCGTQFINCVGFLINSTSSSQAKDLAAADTNKQLVDALSNSTPNK